MEIDNRDSEESVNGSDEENINDGNHETDDISDIVSGEVIYITFMFYQN